MGWLWLRQWVVGGYDWVGCADGVGWVWGCWVCVWLIWGCWVWGCFDGEANSPGMKREVKMK